MCGAEKIIAITVDLRVFFFLLRNAEWNMYHLAHAKHISSEIILRWKLIPSLEQISNHCRQASPPDSNKEHPTMAAASPKPGTNFVRLVSHLIALHPSLFHVKRKWEYLPSSGIRKISIRNISAFKGQIFCTTTEFIFILSVSWMEVENFILLLLLFSANSEHILCAGGGEVCFLSQRALAVLPNRYVTCL